MERRTFLINSSKLSLSTVASSMLIGCGGSTTDTNITENTTENLSEIDTKILSFDTTQKKIYDSHTQIQNNLNFTNTPLNNFYANTFPQDAEDTIIPILSDNYLTHTDNTKNIWQNAQTAHQIAFDQYKHQYTKMKASLRLFDYKQKTIDEASFSELKSSTVNKLKEKTIRENKTLNQFSEQLKNLSIQSFSVTQIDLVENTLSSIFDGLNEDMEDNVNSALDYTGTVYELIEEFLVWLNDEALSNLHFNSVTEILMSLARVSIAILSILGLTTLRSFDSVTSTLTSEQQKNKIFLIGNKIDSKVSSIWMRISSKVTLGSIDGLKNNVKLSVDTGSIPDHTELIADLQSKSQFLTIIAVVFKEIFAKTGKDINENEFQSFTSGSTAETFKILFGSDKNPYDEALNNMMDQKKDDFDLSDSSFSETLDRTFKISIISNAQDTETDAYQFALQLAEYAYRFATDTSAQAIEFATHLADLAYAFVIDIEEDAYQFALQGMEWGYLFASRGEEVGLMADRILWMAVQIGVMADRIGEMADRIVYTEQLIVYTEILILDFGILIYGFGSQITNLILTGMALIFDREWYTPDANNSVLDTINENVMVMLENMQEYALAVLEHQLELRESTLDGLDDLPYSQLEE